MALFRRRQPAPSRPPAADLASAAIEVDGVTLRLADALVGARVGAAGLELQVHHPVLADLAEGPRLEAARALLDETLGTEAVRACVSTVHAAVAVPLDAFGLEPLRTFVRGLGIDVEAPAASGDEVDGTDEGGQPH